MASIEKSSTPKTARFDGWDADHDHVDTAPDFKRAAKATVAHVLCRHRQEIHAPLHVLSEYRVRLLTLASARR
jgi:hypothetical protein